MLREDKDEPYDLTHLRQGWVVDAACNPVRGVRAGPPTLGGLKIGFRQPQAQCNACSGTEVQPRQAP